MAFVMGHLTSHALSVAQTSARALLRTDQSMGTTSDLPQKDLQDWTLEELFDYLSVWGLEYHTDTGKWEHLTISGRQPLTPRRAEHGGS
jgi:hypothetical protein